MTPRTIARQDQSDRQVQPESMENQGLLVPRARRGHQASPLTGRLLQLSLVAVYAHLGPLGHLGILVPKERVAPKGLWDQELAMGNQVLEDLQDDPELLASLAPMANLGAWEDQGNLEPMAEKAPLAQKDVQDLVDQKDKGGPQAEMELQALQASKDHKGHLGPLETGDKMVVGAQLDPVQPLERMQVNTVLAHEGNEALRA